MQNSPVTAMVYSENGKFFATGHENGGIQLWEGKELVLNMALSISAYDQWALIFVMSISVVVYSR